VSASSEVARLEQALRRRFRVIETEVALGRTTISLAHPASSDELISEEDYLKDERLPYWAEPWPSSFVLARHLVSDDSLVGVGGGRSMLELGCGTGLVAAAATLAGFAVTASDYYEDALRFARVNVWRVARQRIEVMHLDWRVLPALPRCRIRSTPPRSKACLPTSPADYQPMPTPTPADASLPDTEPLKDRLTFGAMERE